MGSDCKDTPSEVDLTCDSTSPALASPEAPVFAPPSAKSDGSDALVCPPKEEARSCEISTSIACQIGTPSAGTSSADEAIQHGEPTKMALQGSEWSKWSWCGTLPRSSFVWC